MAIDYGIDVENSAVFYLFDRDRESNRPRHIIPAMERYGNSRGSSGFDMNGLFLLSYPSIEAYLSTANGDDTELESGKEAKKYIENRNYHIKDLNEEKLLVGVSSMISSVEHITQILFSADLVDIFSDINKEILSFQDRRWAENHRYMTLSLLSASFIDLGIITLN